MKLPYLDFRNIIQSMAAWRSPVPVPWNAKTELTSCCGCLLCPSCKCPYTEKHIFQCPDGHLFCFTCSEKSKLKCPLCSRAVPAGKIRNRPLEHIAFNTSILDIIGVTTTMGDGSSVHDNPAFQCSNASCASIGSNLPNAGVRFKCMICEDCDICEACIDTGFHDHHPTLRIANSEQAVTAQALLDSTSAERQCTELAKVHPQTPSPQQRAPKRKRGN